MSSPENRIAMLQVEATQHLTRAVGNLTEIMAQQTKVLQRLHDAILIAVSTFADDIKSDKMAEGK